MSARLLQPPSPFRPSRLASDYASSSADHRYTDSRSSSQSIESPVYAPGSEPITPADDTSLIDQTPYFLQNVSKDTKCGNTYVAAVRAKGALVQHTDRAATETTELALQREFVGDFPFEVDEKLDELDSCMPPCSVGPSDSFGSLNSPSHSPEIHSVGTTSSLYSLPNVMLDLSPSSSLVALPSGLSGSGSGHISSASSISTVGSAATTGGLAKAVSTTSLHEVSSSTPIRDPIEDVELTSSDDRLPEALIFMLTPVAALTLAPRTSPVITDYTDKHEKTAQAEIETGRYIPADALRIFLFLPWLIVVGATIFLYPSLLPSLVFRPTSRPTCAPHSLFDFFPRAPAPAGAFRRLAHYAQTASGYVGAFATILAVMGMWGGVLGLTFAVLALGRAASVWVPFALGFYEDASEDMRCVWAVLLGDEEALVKRMVNEVNTEKQGTLE